MYARRMSYSLSYQSCPKFFQIANTYLRSYLVRLPCHLPCFHSPSHLKHRSRIHIPLRDLTLRKLLTETIWFVFKEEALISIAVVFYLRCDSKSTTSPIWIYFSFVIELISVYLNLSRAFVETKKFLRSSCVYLPCLSLPYSLNSSIVGRKKP